MLYYPDMPTLHLTPDEQEIFSALPGDIRADVVVVPEKITFIDTDEQRAVRMRTLVIKNPALQELKPKLAAANAGWQLVEYAREFDFASLSKEELIDLYYTMGPDPMTAMIEHLLREVQCAQDIEDIAPLTFIRHGVLSVLQ